MTDRFPLVVNETSRKIEEMVSGDNLDLTGNGIVISGDTGTSSEFLKSTGSGTLEWATAGNVYLNQSQTITNKIFNTCSLDAASNTIVNISNDSIINAFVTINGQQVALGSSTTTPDTNTTYSISAGDGGNANEFIVTLTDSSSATDNVTFVAGTNVSLSRNGDAITINSSFVDTDTITTVQASSGGSAQSGTIQIAAGAFTTVTQTGKTITIAGQDTDTITSFRAETGNTFKQGNVTLLGGTEVTLTQADDGSGGTNITIDSVDTVTQIKGGTDLGSELVSGDINLIAGSNVTLTQSTNDITIASTDTNTVTQLATGTETLASGDFKFVQAGATTISQATDAVSGLTTITIESVNDDTGATLGGTNGISLNGSNFELTNNTALSNNKLLKWDDTGNQLINSLVSDDGSTVTVDGDFVVSGTTTTVNTTNLSIADNIIELRRGTDLSGTNGGIQINRTTDSSGTVLSYIQLQWFETGGYFRTFNGSVSNRLVTENETQTLTNKQLTSPTLVTPDIGVATATTVNGLAITSTASSTLTVTNSKTIAFENSITLKGTDNITIDFGNGPTAGGETRVTYRSDSLGVFSATTSTEFRGIISDAVGSGSLIFNDNPLIKNGITTDAASATFNLINTNATTVNFAGDATAITMGKLNDGTTIVNHSLEVKGDITLGTDGTGNSADSLVINAITGFRNADINLFADEGNPIRIGRGYNASEDTNMCFGVSALSGTTMTGSQNTIIGYESGEGITTGSTNVSLGYQTLRTCFAGDNNTAIGHSAVKVIQDGEKNTGIGSAALGGTVNGSNNTCVGYYAGHALQGSGNVLIGAAPTADSNSVTYSPPLQNGDNQLVIGSGDIAWIRGSSDGNVTFPSVTVAGNTVLQGNLTVNGTTTSINSSVIQVDDKSIELASVDNATFTASATSGNNTLESVTSHAGLIVGMELIQGPGGSIPVPSGSVITGLGSNVNGLTVSIDKNLTASGQGTFTATGPTDLGADQGGIILKGTTDKTIIYDHSRPEKYWTFSESLELAVNKQFAINDQLVLSSDTLGSGVVNSSLTSVGTLNGLSVTDANISSAKTQLLTRISEGSRNSFTTSNSSSLTATGWAIDCGGRNTVLYTATTSTFNRWEFNNVNIGNNETLTITLIIDANSAAVYVDDCTVDGNVITNGIFWSGGSPPPPSTEIDILTFLFVKDNSGTTRVFGQANTNFS